MESLPDAHNPVNPLFDIIGFKLYIILVFLPKTDVTSVHDHVMSEHFSFFLSIYCMGSKRYTHGTTCRFYCVPITTTCRSSTTSTTKFVLTNTSHLVPTCSICSQRNKITPASYLHPVCYAYLEATYTCPQSLQ